MIYLYMFRIRLSRKLAPWTSQSPGTGTCTSFNALKATGWCLGDGWMAMSRCQLNPAILSCHTCHSAYVVSWLRALALSIWVEWPSLCTTRSVKKANSQRSAMFWPSLLSQGDPTCMFTYVYLVFFFLFPFSSLYDSPALGSTAAILLAMKTYWVTYIIPFRSFDTLLFTCLLMAGVSLFNLG